MTALIFAKMESLNFIFSVGVGIWTMIKLYKLLFKPAEDFTNITIDRYVPNIHTLIAGLLTGDARKQTLLILIWWILGIATVIATCKLLNVLLISP